MNAVLLRAAELIEENGWVQNKPRCGTAIRADTAIQRAAFELDADSAVAHDSFRPFIDVPEAKCSIGGNVIINNIAMWNDFKDRTKEEVIAKLREAGNA